MIVSYAYAITSWPPPPETGEASWTGLGKIRRTCRALAKEDKFKFFRNTGIHGFARKSRGD